MPPLDDGSREFILRTFRSQTLELGGKIDELAKSTEANYNRLERRVLDLEKEAVEEKQTRIRVEQLIGKVDTIIDRDRKQDLDIGRIEGLLRPVVKAEASTEGQLAGAVAGHRAGKKTSIIGGIIAVVVVSVLNHCEQQIQRGLFSDPPSSAEKK
jgi:hypothetical protein